MMIYAYDQEYLPLAQRVMGDMYDFAVNTLDVPINDFHNMFLISGMDYQFEIGNPTFVAGKNGCEVAKTVIQKCKGSYPEEEDAMYVDKSPEYWTGWALAYYQWFTSVSYKKINKCVPIEEVRGMYNTLHEADITKFVSVMNEKIKGSLGASTLKRLRMYAELTQKQLAEKSGVPLRQIQLFEQGQRNIGKTGAVTLISIAKVLQCSCEDLII